MSKKFTIKNVFTSLIILAYIFVCYIAASDGGDFDVYLDAAIKLNNGQNIYAPPFIHGLQYYYSPLFALILIPTTGNFVITEFFWLLLSGVFLVRTFYLIKAYINVDLLTNREYLFLVIITSFFILRFVMYNLFIVQVTIFLLWAMFESISLVNKRKSALGGLLLAFAINVKLMPLVAIPYLLYRLKFKAVIYAVLFSISLLFIPAIFIGYDYNTFLLKEWGAIINPVNSEHLIEFETNFQSFVGMIPVFLTETSGEFEYGRNIINLSENTAILIMNVIRLFFIAFTLYFLGFSKKNDLNDLSELRALAYIALLTPMIFPHQQKYAIIFIYPMIIYLTYYSLLLWKNDKSIKSKIFVFSLLIISLIFSPFIGSDFLGRTSYDLLHYFRILGLAVLFLIVFAVISNPGKKWINHS